MRVLLIERHQLLARALQRGLEEEGFAVDVASAGEDGDREAMTAAYNAIIFDPLLHKETDLSLPRRWRLRGLQTPVLVLTTPSDSTARPEDCDLGADASLRKPFALEELLGRLRALTSRALAGC
jgi:two-component system OmpR family response regulator